MKRDFEDKYKDSLPEDDLVSIEDMTDEEFREFMEKEFIREAQERKEELFADEDFQDYEQTDEEVDEAYRKFVNRLKEEGIYREEKPDKDTNKNAEGTAEEITSEDTPSEETTSEKEPSVVVPLHRKRKKLAKVAGIGIVCAISVFAASMTSEANRNYFIDTFKLLSGNDTRMVSGNNQDNENVNTDEYNAIAEIENKLGVEVPEFYYRPYGMEFKDYFIGDASDVAWLEYLYKDNIISFHISTQKDSIVSNMQSIAGDVKKSFVINIGGIEVTIEKIEEENDLADYTAKWEKNNVSYFLSGKISGKEIKKIIKNIVY